MNKIFAFIVSLLWGMGIQTPLLASQSNSLRTIPLPHYNPVRYRVPADPQALHLHKQIVKVSHKLNILRKVPLDDPSIEPRFKKIIKTKINKIESKLNSLKQDMAKRTTQLKEEQSFKPSIRIKPSTKSARPEKLKKSDRSLPTKTHNKSDTSQEIAKLRQSLDAISRKLAALEAKEKQSTQISLGLQKSLNSQKSPSPQKSSVKQTSHHQNNSASSAFITLPIARSLPPSEPRLVRTTAIYLEQPHKPVLTNISSARQIQIPLPLRKPLISLPVAKPMDILKLGKNKKNRNRKYVSVEDDEGQDGQWSTQAVEKAHYQCKKLFKNLNINFAARPPIKNGRCGTPAPIYLKSFGKDHIVAISPPATINCKATAVIARWMNTKIQPLAIKLLGSPIAKIHNVASYNCRNRYGRKNGRISEHAYANALDIMAFTTKNGDKVDLLQHFYGDDEKGLFLRSAHKLACKDKFGTVLGPDANAAHKNHFHLDLAKRRRSAYCE